MVRILILVALIGLVAWWIFGRARRQAVRREEAASDASAAGKGRKARKPPPQQIIACTHCGVHLPHADAVTDAVGRPYCGEEHRLAGPP